MSARTRSLRYVVVGTIAFVVDYGVSLLLLSVLPLLVANSVGFVVANVVNFFLAHFWVFRGVREARAALRAYAYSLAASTVGLGINDFCVWLGVVQIGLAFTPAKILATIVTFAWNFLVRERFIYRNA